MLLDTLTASGIVTDGKTSTDNKKELCDRVDFVNRVYNAKVNVDSTYDGKTELRTMDGTQSLFIGTEQECLAWLSGWMDCARVLSNRHSLIYGGF